MSGRDAGVGVRATTPQPGAGKCAWCEPHPSRASQRAQGKGLSPSMCRKHVEHLARHGHPTKASYPATWLAPLERLARVFAEKPSVQLAALRTRNLILGGTPPGQIYPTDPKLKAKAVLGRLYLKYCGERSSHERTRWPRLRTLDELSIDVVCIALSVRTACALEPSAPPSDNRFAHAQIGKVIFRRAGGWLRRFERHDHSQREHLLREDGRLVAGPAIYEVHLNRYGASRGPALVHLGCSFWQATEEAWQAHGIELVGLTSGLSALQPRTSATRGGKRERLATSKNTLIRPHDRERKLTRKI